MNFDSLCHRPLLCSFCTSGPYTVYRKCPILLKLSFSSCRTETQSLIKTILFSLSVWLHKRLLQSLIIYLSLALSFSYHPSSLIPSAFNISSLSPLISTPFALFLSSILSRPHIPYICRGPNVVIDDGQVDAPNSLLISCLDSSLGRAFVCSAGGLRFAPRPWHVCLGAYLEDRDDPGQVSL